MSYRNYQRFVNSVDLSVNNILFKLLHMYKQYKFTVRIPFYSSLKGFRKKSYDLCNLYPIVTVNKILYE